MKAPLSITRVYDTGHAIGNEFSTDAVLIVNPAATRADVLALALQRAEQLYTLIDTLTVCRAGVVYDVAHVADLFCGPADDVRMLLTALQAMEGDALTDRPAPDEMGRGDD